MTRMISYNSMMLDGGGSCWKYAARVNHCCAIHDNCYGLQLGRENCDQNFCDCLLRATAPDTCVATALKCLATIEGGEEAYLNSATYQEQLDFVKIVPNINGIEKEFLLLYQECPLVMETIKSCSLLTNICINNEEENCEQNLSECVQQAADLQNSQQCWEATHHAQQSLSKPNIFACWKGPGSGFLDKKRLERCLLDVISVQLQKARPFIERLSTQKVPKLSLKTRS
nr:Hypothetical protein CBG00662 [Haemonchus contortus]